MPIDKRSSKDKIIKELIQSYKKTGKIGNTVPKDLAHARKIASAIAYSTKSESTIQRINSILNSICENSMTKTSEFKEWFKDSVVVDDKGNPLVVYHGTTGDFDDFDTNRAKSGILGKIRGIFFTPKIGLALAYAGTKGNLKYCYLSIKHPLINDTDVKQKEVSDEELSGYDGIINYHNGEIESFVVFSPEQIKVIKTIK